jgi:hypothetical protein
MAASRNSCWKFLRHTWQPQAEAAASCVAVRESMGAAASHLQGVAVQDEAGVDLGRERVKLLGRIAPIQRVQLEDRLPPVDEARGPADADSRLSLPEGKCGWQNEGGMRGQAGRRTHLVASQHPDADASVA